MDVSGVWHCSACKHDHLFQAIPQDITINDIDFTNSLLTPERHQALLDKILKPIPVINKLDFIEISNPH